MLKPRDLGGKPPVLIFPDNAFFYAFTSYASSGAPLKVFRIEDGKAIDVSTDPALKPLHEENMRQNRKSYVEDHNNGACAPYVASAARIGQFAEAWKVMLQNYDRESDWQLNFCAVAGGDCAKSASFKTFPQVSAPARLSAGEHTLSHCPTAIAALPTTLEPALSRAT